MQKINYNFTDDKNRPLDGSINAGKYKSVADDSALEDITLSQNSFAYEIIPQTVLIPKVSNTVLKFNFNSQSLVYEDVDTNVVEVTGQTAVNMGEYTAIFSLIDINNYVWEDGSNQPIFVKWSIDPPIHPVVLIIFGVAILLMIGFAVYKTRKIKKLEEQKRANINSNAIDKFNKK